MSRVLIIVLTGCLGIVLVGIQLKHFHTHATADCFNNSDTYVAKEIRQGLPFAYKRTSTTTGSICGAASGQTETIVTPFLHMAAIVDFALVFAVTAGAYVGLNQIRKTK